MSYILQNPGPFARSDVDELTRREPELKRIVLVDDTAIDLYRLAFGHVRGSRDKSWFGDLTETLRRPLGVTADSMCLGKT